MLALTLDHSLARRLWAWAEDRFPPGNAIGCAVIFGAAMFVGRFTATDGPIALTPLDLAALLAAVSFFLLLRVFDEHKDYEDDLKNYPERVLSRGLITLNHLKAVGAVCVFLQLSTSLAVDRGVGRVTAAWVLALGYALLMLKEFFCHEWLRTRIVPYALSHMLISPLTVLWFYLVGTGSGSLTRPVWYLAVLSYATAAAFEVTRKTRGPEEERESVDSYSKNFGLFGSALAMLGTLLVALVSTWFLLADLAPESITLRWVTVASFLPITGSIFAFVKAPSASARKRNEGLSALALVFCHVAPIISVISQRGISWQF